MHRARAATADRNGSGRGSVMTLADASRACDAPDLSMVSGWVNFFPLICHLLHRLRVHPTLLTGSGRGPSVPTTTGPSISDTESSNAETAVPRNRPHPGLHTNSTERDPVGSLHDRPPVLRS